MFLNKEYEKLDTPTTDSSGFDWKDAPGKYTDKLNKIRKKTEEILLLQLLLEI